MTGPLTNWAGNITFGAAQVSRPGSVAELQQVVAASPRVRALGTGHSFSDIADTGGVLVSVVGLPPVIELDCDRAQVTVSAGLRYGELASWLDERGWALANLGSLPHISVAGACATGTHGSGDGNRCLAAAVAGAELVTAGGDLVQARRDDPGPAGQDFAGMPVSLGTLGVLTQVTLDLVPAFTVRQWVYDGIGGAERAAHLDEIFARGYSVSLFTRWAPDGLSQAWVKELAGPGEPGTAQDRWLGGTLATGPGTRCRAWIPRRAPSSWAGPGRGTCGCRTSGWSSPRARATSSSPSTWCRGSTRPPRSRRWAGWRTWWRRSCRSPSCARSPRTGCG